MMKLRRMENVYLKTRNHSCSPAVTSSVEEAIYMDTEQFYYRAKHNASAVLGIVIMSVCPSVCHTRAL